MKEIFCTKYNNNGDYAGFLFMGPGQSLSERDRKAINQLAEEFYQDIHTDFERRIKSAVGDLIIVGKLNPIIERRKILTGSIASPEEHPQRTLDPQEMFFRDLDKWKTLMLQKTPKDEGFNREYADLMNKFQRSDFKIKERQVFAHLLQAFIQSNNLEDKREDHLAQALTLY